MPGPDDSASNKSEQNQQTLLRLLQAITTLPAQITLYAFVLGAIILTFGGATIPAALATLVTGAGINLLSNILERVARGEDVSNDEINQAIQSAIEDSQIAEQLHSNETQRLVGRLFRENSWIKATIVASETNILQKLDEIADEQFETLTLELRELIQEIVPPCSLLTFQEFAERMEHAALTTHSGSIIGRETILDSLKANFAAQIPLIVLHGPGGIGKTRLMLALPQIVEPGTKLWYVRTEAETIERELTKLANNDQHIIVVDEAHRFAPLSHLREVLVNADYAGKISLVLLTRSVFKETVRYQLGTLRADQFSEIEVQPLTNTDIDKILQGQPYVIANDPVRHTLIDLAEGNPLVAGIGANLVQRDIAISGLTRDEILAQYLNEIIQDLAEAGYDDRYIRFLQVLAAIGIINLSDQILQERIQQIVGISDVEEQQMISRLEQAGLVERYWMALEITSEVLADHILVHHFFNPETKRADYQQQIIEPFLELRPKEIMSNLAKTEIKGESTEAGSILGDKLAEFRQLILDNGIVVRLNILRCLDDIAYLRPDDILMIVTSIIDGPEQPAETIQDPFWGRRNLYHKTVLDRTIDLLERTIYRGSWRDAIVYLHKVAIYEIPSEEYAAVRKKAQDTLVEVVKFKLGKPYQVQLTLLEYVPTWLNENFQQNLDLVLALLQPMLSMEFDSFERDPTQPFAGAYYRGVLSPSDPLRQIREQAVENLQRAYQLASTISERLKTVNVIGYVLPYYLSGNQPSDELWAWLEPDCSAAVSFFTDMVFPQDEYPIFDAISDWLWRVDRFAPYKGGTYEALRQQLLEHSKYQVYRLLVGSDFSRDKLGKDWEKAEEDRRQEVDAYLASFNPETFDNTISVLEKIITQAEATEEKVTFWFSFLLRNLGEQKPDLACQLVEQAITENLTLKHYLGPVIGGVKSADADLAWKYIDSWIATDDSILLLTIAQNYRFQKDGALSDQDWAVLEQLLAKEIVQVDHEILRLIAQFGASSSNTAIELIKVLAARGDERILLHIADILAMQFHLSGKGHPVIEFANFQDYLGIIQNFERLPSLSDYEVEICLGYLGQVEPVQLIDIIETRIAQKVERQKTNKFYHAIPFEFSRATNNIRNSPSYPDILIRVRDWLLREEIGFYSEAPQVLHKISGGNLGEPLYGILMEWVESGDIQKIRAVARALGEFNYGQTFYDLGREIIIHTNDKAAWSSIRSGIHSTPQAILGPMSNFTKNRLREIQPWLQDENFRVRAFAKREVEYLQTKIDQEQAEEAFERKHW